MGLAHVCYVLRLDDTALLSPEKAETDYQENIKPILSYLYANPSFFLSIWMSGITLEWFESRHPEFRSVLEELLSRKQVEIIGGGYYNPLFPLLLPVDRVGQIELLTTSIRKLTGKRPRGMYPVHSTWDPSLVSGIHTAGMEYILLDSAVANAGRTGQPVTTCPFVVEDCGKTLTVIPMNQSMVPSTQVKVESYVTKLKKIAVNNSTPIICCMLSPDKLKLLIEDGWFTALIKEIANYSIIELSKPSRYLKTAEEFVQAFIPAGSIIPHMNARDFITENKEINMLYAFMLLLNTEINQYRGDKMRKKAARDELWKAQHYQAYWPEEEDLSDLLEYRRKMYRHLLNAESLLTETDAVPDSTCTSYDYDMDGYDEFLFRFPFYSAFVSTLGGPIFELDVRHCAVQYTMPVRAKGDKYPRKMFTDFLVDADRFSHLYQFGTQLTETVFAPVRYKVLSFSRSKHELLLWAKGTYITGQEASLTKRYSFSETGVKVQYIVKNESNKPLNALFAVESNVSLPEEDEERILDVISGDSHELACLDQMFIRQQNVSFFQISDKKTETSFLFEPNEDASICLVPLTIGDSYVSTCATFYWKLDIQPGYEVEKTLFLSIKSPGKKALSKKGRKKK